MVIPVPVVLTPPGERVIIQLPETGRPLRLTLPVGTVTVVRVIVPTTGAFGVTGGGGIIIFADGTDKHPSLVDTVKL